MNNYYRHLLDLLANNKSAWSITISKVNGSSPGSLGQKMLIEADSKEVSGTIGGGNLEYHLIEKVRKEKPKKFLNLSFPLSKQAELGMVCGGDIEVIIEPINIKDHLVIFGAGHCAQALSNIIKNLNFNISIYDDREQWLQRHLFPDNTNLILGDFTKINEFINVTEDDYLVVMTYGHEFDNIVTKQLLHYDAKYLGIMGSKSKSRELHDYLANDFSKFDIEKISCPIGISINSHTPYEIAVSIAGEIINLRNSIVKREF